MSGENAFRKRDFFLEITSDYKAVDADWIVADASQGAITITLPRPDLVARIIVKKIDPSINHVLIITPNSETIDGLASVVISAQYGSYEVLSDGANWFISNVFGGYVINSGITTYYPLDEGEGVHVTDRSQYGNHGVLKEGPVWTVENGKMGLMFDGVDDYIEDSKGRHIVKEGTTGFWSEVKIGDETKIVGTGTKFYFSSTGDDLEGQFVTDFADYCTSLVYFYCHTNSFSGTLPSFAACTSLAYFYCYTNSFSGTLPSFAACTSLAYFYCYTNSFSGTLPSFAECTSLATFRCYANSFSGTLPSFAECTSLAYFNCHTNSFSGELPTFAACTSLANFNCHTNSFSGYATGGFATQVNLATLDARSNAISNAADINAILADLRTSYDLVDRVACRVKLEGGTNAAPTGQGVTDKNFLNANGWTVTSA